jgi:probable HAF family extracellular repeat protein
MRLNCRAILVSKVLPLLVLSFVELTLLGGGSLSAATYLVVDLGAGFVPLAINILGQIAGDRWDRDDGNRSFFWEEGVFTPVLHPGGDEVRVRDINTFGRVVGAHRDDIGGDHAFVWDKTNGMTELEPSDFNYSWASGITDSGVITGELFGQAVIWQTNGTMSHLGDLGGGYSSALAINSVGEVVGLSSLDPTGLLQHAFIWQPPNMHDLGVVESITRNFQEYAIAWAINDQGQVVGTAIGYENTPFHNEPYYGFVWSITAGLEALLQDVHFFGNNNAGQAVGEMFASDPLYGPDIWNAALYENGQIRSLNDLISPTTEYYLQCATGINDLGQIIAYGQSSVMSSDGNYLHGYLLTPVPEPCAPLLTIAALFLLSFCRERIGQLRVSGVSDPLLPFRRLDRCVEAFDLCNPVGVGMFNWPVYPGCASRPWASVLNRFAVNAIHKDERFLQFIPRVICRRRNQQFSRPHTLRQAQDVPKASYRKRLLRNAVEREEVCVVGAVGTAFGVVVGGAGDGDQVVACKLPIDVLEGMLCLIGMVQQGLAKFPGT